MPPQLEPAEVEAAVNEFQRKLERLRVLYEQYFLGISKREPMVPLKDVVRVMRLLDQQQIRNTGLRFRLRNLVQKFNTYRTYWARTTRAIEAGTYRRDVARVRRKYSRDGIDMPDLGKLRTVGEVEKAMAEAAETKKALQSRKQRKQTPVIRGKPADELRDEVLEQPSLQQKDTVMDQPAIRAKVFQTTPPPRPEAKPPPVPQSNISDDALQSLYRRMVKAKRMVGQNTEKVTVDGLSRTIDRQMPKLRQMHPGKEIDFQVVIRDNKVILKARPK